MESLGTALMDLFMALEQSAFGFTIRSSALLYPLANVAHILGAILLVGPIMMLDLRLLGLSRRIPLRLMAQHLLPWAIFGLLIMLVSGFLLFTAEATAYAVNPVFQLKIALIVAGVLNAVIFELLARRNWRDWENYTVPLFPRLLALLSLVNWLLVAVAGRLIAYF
ncbi:MAG: hypothetical protein K0S54_740 [Alphaproteobacteria bacterium]|jgi:hypothetical protein|nr:hypothetical protein [Alphaproteobacteria bacterium]